MRNVAITGVSGYLGNLLAKRIAQEAEVERIIGMDIKEPAFQSPKFTFIKHDVRRPFADIFINNKIDTAIHFAFIVAPIHDERKAHEINMKGSQNFMDASAQAKVEQVFYMGSYSDTAHGLIIPKYSPRTRLLSLTRTSLILPIRLKLISCFRSLRPNTLKLR